MSNPNIRLEVNLITALKNEVFVQKNENDKIKKFLGLDYEFFSLIAESGSGRFHNILLYLAQKDDDFLLILGLSYIMNITKLKQEYVEYNNYKNKKTQNLSNIIMFTLIKLANMVFPLNRNGQNFEEDKIFITLKAKIKENLFELSEYVLEKSNTYDKSSILTLDYSEIFDGIGRDFTKFLEENIYSKEAAVKRTTYRNIVNNYTKDLLSVFRQITKQINELLYSIPKQKNEENNYFGNEKNNMEDILNLFFSLFLGNDANNNSEIIQNLIKFNIEEGSKPNMINKLISNLNFSYSNNTNIANDDENKFYSLIVELLILGFGNLEKEKNGSVFSIESSLKHLFKKYP